jgi:hypothetical protein
VPRPRRVCSSPSEIRIAALAAGKMSAETRAAAGDLAAQLTLDELALLAEFDGDSEAARGGHIRAAVGGQGQPHKGVLRAFPIRHLQGVGKKLHRCDATE